MESSTVLPDHENEKLIGLEDDTELTPHEGMEFESEDAARDFYTTYARSTGFQLRMSRYTRSRRDNSIMSRRIVCSKEGFCETRPCDDLHSDQKQKRAGTRVGCKAMIMIKNFGPGKWIVTKFVKKHNHGPVPPRKLDARPVNQDTDLMEKPHSIEENPAKEPFEGMEFESEEAAKLFYVNYARINGFRARISRYCRSRRDNSIISRQIVCSKEGFREVRTKKVMTDEGKMKRPRMITRVGCKAMIVVKKMNSGKWMVSKFEKEHNHSLSSYSKADPSISNSTAAEVDYFAASITDPNEVNTDRHDAGTHCNSPDSLTVLYNNLCQEAIKFAKEGSVTEEIYHVAVSALKEAADKVAEVKRIPPTLPHSGCISESKQEVPQIKPGTSLQSANDGGLKHSVPGPKLFKEPNSNLAFVATKVLTDSSLSNCIDNVPQPRDLLINGGQCSREPKGSYLHFGNIKEACSQKPQNTSSDQAIHVKEKGILGSSEETIVAIPAIPLALCMPATRNLHGTSSDGPYSLLAAPIEAVPISYCPAQSIRQPPRRFRDLGPFAGVLSDLNNKRKGPNPLVHATALACGARIVPLEEAASLVKAVESKIRCGRAIISKLPSSNLTSLVPPVTMRSSVEDGERNNHSGPPMVDVEHNYNDHSSDETKLQSEPSEFETESDSSFVQPEK